MKKIGVRLLLASCVIFFTLKSFGQRGYDNEITEDYNWNEFDGFFFYKTVLICAAIIVLGLLIRTHEKTFVKGIGTTIIVLGGLGSFIYLGGPILGALKIIWQVVIGAAIYFGIIYWAYINLRDDKQG